MNSILAAPLYLAVFGGAFALVLAAADRLLRVKVDPRAEMLEKILPGLNCGACGYPSCSAYAAAMASGAAKPGMCTSLDAKGVELMRGLFGDVVQKEKEVAVVLCSGGSARKFDYKGISSCSAAVLISGGNIECSWGCLGLGDCVEVCPAGAIKIGESGSAEIDWKKCTGCGLCVETCPRKIIELRPVSHAYYVACSSKDKAAVRKYCKNGCFTCGICTGKKFNPDGVTEMKDNLPAVVWERVKDTAQVEYASQKCPVKVWKKIEI